MINCHYCPQLTPPPSTNNKLGDGLGEGERKPLNASLAAITSESRYLIKQVD